MVFERPESPRSRPWPCQGVAWAAEPAPPPASRETPAGTQCLCVQQGQGPRLRSRRAERRVHCPSFLRTALHLPLPASFSPRAACTASYRARLPPPCLLFPETLTWDAIASTHKPHRKVHVHRRPSSSKTRCHGPAPLPPWLRGQEATWTPHPGPPSAEARGRAAHRPVRVREREGL